MYEVYLFGYIIWYGLGIALGFSAEQIVLLKYALILPWLPLRQADRPSRFWVV